MSDPAQALAALLADHRAWLIDNRMDCQCGYQAGHGIDWHQHVARAVLDSGLVVPIDNHYASLGIIDRLLVSADAESARFKAERDAGRAAMKDVRRVAFAVDLDGETGYAAEAIAEIRCSIVGGDGHG